MKTITSQEILAWAKEHSWYSRYAEQLEKKHRDYLDDLLSFMTEPTESNMNDNQGRIPMEKRTSRLVPEIITAYINHGIKSSFK